MQLVESDILFLDKICHWLSCNQNYIDCGGRPNATWLEVFCTCSKFWEIGQVYKIIGDKSIIGFLVIENDTFHSFIEPYSRTFSNGVNLLNMVFFLMFDTLDKDKIYTELKEESLKKYFLRKGFKKEIFMRFKLNVFSLTKRRYLMQQHTPEGVQCQ